MDSSSMETLSTWSDSKMVSLSLFPVVMDADEEEITSALQNPMNMQDPKMKGSGPLDGVPLSMVLTAYGRNEPVPFDQKEIDRLRDQSAPVKEQSVLEGKQEAPMPTSLKSLDHYNEEDWKAFVKTRADGQPKDWSYEHRLYRRDFRSIVEVRDFLKLDGPTKGIFRERKLQKKKTHGWDSHRSSGTNKYTRGRKPDNSAPENVSVGPSHQIKPALLPGFV